MSDKTLRRRIATLALLVLLACPWAEAGVRPSSPRRVAAPTPTWTLALGRLWTALASMVLKNGCSLDPNGAQCPSHLQGDAGCSLDPDGACVQDAPEVDEGCSLDPDGRCLR